MARRTDRLIASVGFVCIGTILMPAVAPGQAPQEKLECSGQVVDSLARPVPGAAVVGFEQLNEFAAGGIDSRILGRTTTDENGRFQLQGSAENRSGVWLVAWKEGLALGWQGARYSESTRDLTVQLGQSAVLAGTVVDENGQGIAGATVRPCLKMGWMGGTVGVRLPEPREWLTARTDDQGRFRFEHIPSGAGADFWVEAPGHASGWTFWEKGLSNVAGSQFQAGRTDIRIVLKPESAIRGKVIDEDTGRGVPGVRVLARPEAEYANYSCVDPVASGEDGTFLYKGLQADDYSLTVVPPQDRMADWVGKEVKVTTAAGRTVDVNLPVGKGGLIEITILEAGTRTPLPGAWVNVRQAASSGPYPCWYEIRRTGADGVVRLRTPVGECHFSVGAETHDAPREPEPVRVVTGEVFRRQIELQPLPSLAGIVRGLDGQPASGVIVTSRPVCEQAVSTDGEGRFKVSWRPYPSIREVFVLARDPQRNLAGLAPSQGSSQPVEVILEPAFTVRGRVTDPNHKPIPLASVSLRAFMTGWITGAAPAVVTDANGVYEFLAILPPREGFRYRMEVRAEGYGPIELRDLPFDNAPTKRVEVAPVALAPANRSLSGVVLDASGNPAAGVPIFISGPRGSDTAGQPRHQVISDQEGKFAVDGVCAGPVRIQAGVGEAPGFLDARGGDRDLKVVLGRSSVHVKYESLLQKPLPDLKGLVDLTPEQMQGKPVLLCLFDMDQRPSRRCLEALAKRAGALERRGLLVVALQAAKADEADLKTWAAKQDLRFPLGRMQTDVEKTKSAWGVQSLPWLILTDGRHVVRAEGFAPGEVDQVLEKVK